MAKRYSDFNMLLCGIAAVQLFIFIMLCPSIVRAEIKLNDTAPNITLRDMDGKLVFCKGILEKKPVLVSFFYTNCVPCRREIPELQKLHDKYSSKVSFFLIATDKEGADIVKPYIQNLNVSIPVLIDKFSDVVKDFGITIYPTLALIGRDGKIKYICHGYKEETVKNIEKIIKELK